MVQKDDRVYYKARAKAERRSAADSANAAVASVHLQLAEEYERLLEGAGRIAADDRPERSPLLSLVTVPGAAAAGR